MQQLNLLDYKYLSANIQLCNLQGFCIKGVGKGIDQLMMLSNWFDHLTECFSYKQVQFK